MKHKGKVYLKSLSPIAYIFLNGIKLNDTT